MTTLREAATAALEALEKAAWCVQYNYEPENTGRDWDEQIAALRAALAEPVECPHGVTDGNCKECYEQSTTPRKPLTEEALSKIIDAEIGFNSCCGWEAAFARAIERAHEIK